jgi:hypothetical protein
MIISAKNGKNSFGSPILTNYQNLINDFHNFDDLFYPEVDPFIAFSNIVDIKYLKVCTVNAWELLLP